MGGLRFCMVTTFYPPHNFGGDGIGVQRLARALARRGHTVTVVYDADAYRALQPGAEPVAAPEPDGVRVHALRSRLGAVSPLLTQQLGRPVVHGRAIRRLLDEGGFDVIHFNNVSLVGGPGVLSAGAGVKVYEAHEHWLVCASHVLWRHGREPCEERQCLRCVLRHRRPPQLWRYTGYLDRQLDNIDVFIAKSEFSRQRHYAYGFPRTMRVLPYFLPDADAAEREDDGARPHDRPYFLFVGRLERLKGLDDVIPIFRGYADADLLVAGDGAHGPALRRLAAGSPRIRFLGRVAPDALARYYRHAIALVAPSIGYETFGIILIEAFRHGTPVIARRVGPFPEIVERAGGGLLFDGPAELEPALRALQQDAGRRARLASAARAAFLREWTEAAVVPRYLDLVRRAAERRDLRRIARALAPEDAA